MTGSPRTTSIWQRGRASASLFAGPVAGLVRRAGDAGLVRRSGPPVPPSAPDPAVTRVVEAYAPRAGRTDRVGEWWLPAGAAAAGVRLPTVVLVHGGFWRAGYDRHLQDAVAADLANRGHLVWNLDYRPSRQPWPATLADVAAGYDHLTVGAHAALVDAARIAVVGHSAGGHLALWLASRHRLPAGTSAVLAPTAGVPRPVLAVSQAGVAALAVAAEQRLGRGAAVDLVQAGPDGAPDRWAVADPVALLPTGVRTVLVHGTADEAVPVEQSERYAAAARGAGDDCRVVLFHGGHDEHLDPGSVAAVPLREALDDALGDARRHHPGHGARVAGEHPAHDARACPVPDRPGPDDAAGADHAVP